MKTTEKYKNQGTRVIISLVIYFTLFYLLLHLFSANEMLIDFLKTINNFFLPMPQYLLMEDMIKSILPLVYFVVALLCFFIFLLAKLIQLPKKMKIIIGFLIKIAILFSFLFLINYLKSFYDNKHRYEQYIELNN